jgi:hypothetical protein
MERFGRMRFERIVLVYKGSFKPAFYTRVDDCFVHIFRASKSRTRVYTAYSGVLARTGSDEWAKISKARAYTTLQEFYL